jgi:DsbC/DsbD-like thiol-disulfide interchange protein
LNCRVLIFLFLLIFMGNGVAFPQDTAIVTILPAKPVVAARGQAVQLTVRAKIIKGFHIQANPAANEFLIPTTLAIETGENFVPEDPVYPPGHPYRLEGSTEDLLTYEDEVTINLPVKIMESASPGKTDIAGKLRFQPCDDIKCLFPRSIPVVIPVEIVDVQK